jgi:hypothetical protein
MGRNGGLECYDNGEGDGLSIIERPVLCENKARDWWR